MVIGVNHPAGRAGGNIGLILFQTSIFHVHFTFTVHFFAVKAFVGEFIMLFTFGEGIIV